jgi:hypothetical protein
MIDNNNNANARLFMAIYLALCPIRVRAKYQPIKRTWEAPLSAL